MERQNGGRVSVSVFPSFQSDVEIAKVGNGISPQSASVVDTSNGGGGSMFTRDYDSTLTDPRMSLKQHASLQGGTQAPPSNTIKYPGGLPSLAPTSPMGPMDRPSFHRMLVVFCSEFFATYILLFLGCMGCVIGLSGGVIPHEQISFTFGLAVMVSVQCFGHISGSHINTIVTVASVVLGNTPIPMAPVYITGQLVGAIAGYASVMLVTPATFLGNAIEAGVKKPGVCSPVLNSHLSPVQGLLVEFIASSILVLVCCAVWDRKNSDKHDSVAIRFGLAIAVLAMAAGPYSGANMNPARSFAPALLNGDWANHWIYWVGPLLAGTVTTSVYKYLFNTPVEEEKLPESIALN